MNYEVRIPFLATQCFFFHLFHLVIAENKRSRVIKKTDSMDCYSFDVAHCDSQQSETSHDDYLLQKPNPGSNKYYDNRQNKALDESPLRPIPFTEYAMYCNSDAPDNHDDVPRPSPGYTISCDNTKNVSPVGDNAPIICQQSIFSKRLQPDIKVFKSERIDLPSDSDKRMESAQLKCHENPPTSKSANMNREESCIAALTMGHSFVPEMLRKLKEKRKFKQVALSDEGGIWSSDIFSIAIPPKMAVDPPVQSVIVGVSENPFDIPHLPAKQIVVSPILIFLPHGARFDKSMVIKCPLVAQPCPGKELKLFHSATDLGQPTDWQHDQNTTWDTDDNTLTLVVEQHCMYCIVEETIDSAKTNATKVSLFIR